MKRLLTKTAFIMGAALSLATPSNANTTPAKSDIDCLVRVMNHEAGGEGEKGQRAVGYVVANRTHSGNYPSSVCGVVYQRSQFSNINRAKVVPTHKVSQLTAIALEILSGYNRASDPTNGAIAFHNKFVHPSWGGLIRTATIGGHIFFRTR